MSDDAALRVLAVEPLPTAVLPGREDDGRSRLLILDAVIVPRGDSPWRADVGARAVGADVDSPPLGRCVRVEIFTGGGFATRATEACGRGRAGRLEPPVMPPGRQRLRLTMRCHADARRLSLWLGDSRLGVVELPPDEPAHESRDELVGASSGASNGASNGATDRD